MQEPNREKLLGVLHPMFSLLNLTTNIRMIYPGKNTLAYFMELLMMTKKVLKDKHVPML